MKKQFFSKSFWTCLLVVCLLTICPATVKAAEGSVTIELYDLGTDREGVGVSLIKIADVTQDGSIPEIYQEYKGAGVSLKKDMTAQEMEAVAEALEKYIGDKKEGAASETTGKAGTVRFENVGTGIYLVSLTKTENYGKVNPFLISVPYRDKNNEINYEVYAQPKSQKPEPSTPTPEPPKKPGGEKPTPPVKTNDEFQPELWAAMLLFSFGTIIACVLARRKEDISI